MIPYLKNKSMKVGNSPATVAARAILQILFTTGKKEPLENLRIKLRDFFKPDSRHEIRAAASVTNVELVSALLKMNEVIAHAGFQVSIDNGVVELLTTRVENKNLADYLRSTTGQSGNLKLSTPTLEVLSCIAFKQPISLIGIEKYFGQDKRGHVVKLKEMKMVEEFAGDGGRLHYVTTEVFLRQFDLDSIESLEAKLRIRKSTP